MLHLRGRVHEEHTDMQFIQVKETWAKAQIDAAFNSEDYRLLYQL